MAKNKYKLGSFFECERCGNIIKIVHEGGGNLICCVKALQETGPPPGEVSGAPVPGGPVAAPAPPVARPKGPAVDPSTIEPIDVFGIYVERDEDEMELVYRQQLFSGGGTEVELLRLLYGQQDIQKPVDGRDTILALLEGRGVFLIGGRECEVTTGATVLVPEGVGEGIRNTMPDEMIVLRILSGG